MAHTLIEQPREFWCYRFDSHLFFWIGEVNMNHLSRLFPLSIDRSHIHRLLPALCRLLRDRLYPLARIRFAPEYRVSPERRDLVMVKDSPMVIRKRMPNWMRTVRAKMKDWLMVNPIVMNLPMAMDLSNVMVIVSEIPMPKGFEISNWTMKDWPMVIHLRMVKLMAKRMDFHSDLVMLTNSAKLKDSH